MVLRQVGHRTSGGRSEYTKSVSCVRGCHGCPCNAGSALDDEERSGVEAWRKD
jgi:hypothetical protein